MKPTLFRKRPVVIEAMYFNGTIASAKRICEWANEPEDEDPAFSFITIDDDKIMAHDVQIWTDEGLMNASPGDYIIKGIKGEFYACKPDIFTLTYEPAFIGARLAPEEIKDLATEIFEVQKKLDTRLLSHMELLETIAEHLIEKGYRKVTKESK